MNRTRQRLDCSGTHTFVWSEAHDPCQRNPELLTLTQVAPGPHDTLSVRIDQRQSATGGDPVPLPSSQQLQQ